VAAPAKHLKQRFRITLPEKGTLEFKQSILPGVHVDAVHRFGRIQQVIQRIAAGACDHYNFAVRINSHEFAVAAGVFPTGIVNEVALVYAVKHPIPQVVDLRHFLTVKIVRVNPQDVSPKLSFC
jgi:hypothetical protein